MHNGGLYSFDQVLASASLDISDRDDWKVFHREMEAQFYFHCGTLILNKALKVSIEDYKCSHVHCLEQSELIKIVTKNFFSC